LTHADRTGTIGAVRIETKGKNGWQRPQKTSGKRNGVNEQGHERGAPVSDHPHPRPVRRGLTAVLVVVGLAGIVFGVIGLLALSIVYGLPLLPLAAFFLAMLLPPLLLLTVLHPRVTVYENGLWIKPLLWRGCWVAWEAVERIEDHTLIQRGTTKERQQEHFGQLVVVDKGLTWPFLVVGIMAGLGRVRAFGISTHAHTGYQALRRTILRQVRSET
jgi:hypothetical protein